MLIFKPRIPKHVLTLLAGMSLLAAGFVFADERILDYHSDILIHTDTGLTVTETIRVRAEGNDISRGIYRDFPTRYKDRLGNHYRAGLDVLDVQRNGAPEPFHTEKRANGVRIYIGSSDRYIRNGVHEYRLRFHTSRQLGFFEDYDELYWNVTGNGWVFPIDHASARIELPTEVEAGDLQTAFYTGPQGANDKQAQSQIVNGRTVVFNTTRGLRAYEGLTVAVGWPKGLVEEPGTTLKAAYFLQDNGAALVLLIGLLAPLCWYLWAWNRFGRDPKKGIIIPRFKPPVGLTPAKCPSASRHLRRLLSALESRVTWKSTKMMMSSHCTANRFRAPEEPARVKAQFLVNYSRTQQKSKWSRRTIKSSCRPRVF